MCDGQLGWLTAEDQCNARDVTDTWTQAFLTNIINAHLNYFVKAAFKQTNQVMHKSVV